MSNQTACAIPRIETPRLVMRGWREDDLDSYAAMVADPEVTRFIGGVMTRADAWRRIAAMLGHWTLRGCGTLGGRAEIGRRTGGAGRLAQSRRLAGSGGDMDSGAAVLGIWLRRRGGNCVDPLRF
ncbi:MAG: GNAT family N-acetyltransferase [Alphaproteobacteria bacterium]|nr:GNAT family N-acetyltransferase [Alphaproteobacteria bacterium]